MAPITPALCSTSIILPLGLPPRSPIVAYAQRSLQSSKGVCTLFRQPSKPVSNIPRSCTYKERVKPPLAPSCNRCVSEHDGRSEDHRTATSCKKLLRTVSLATQDGCSPLSAGSRSMTSIKSERGFYDLRTRRTRGHADWRSISRRDCSRLSKDPWL